MCTRFSSLPMQLPFTMQIDSIFHFLPVFYFSPLTVKCAHRHTFKDTHTTSYTTVSVVRRFIAHSRVPGVPGLLKYPPPPTITAHSNQPPPQLQQSGAREMLRSAISFKPHAGRLLAALWFASDLPTQPTPEWSPYKASSEFTHYLNHPAFCIITFLWFFFIFHVIFEPALSCFWSPFDLCWFMTFGNLDPAVENPLFAVFLEVLEQLSVMRAILSCSCVNGRCYELRCGGLC